MSLFDELKRRNVFRVGAAYLVAAWLMVEASTLILGIYGAPLWVSKVIVALIAVGFPVALFFAWAFEITPEGIKRESMVDRTQSIATETGRRLDVITIVLVVVAIGVFSVDRIWFSGGVTQGHLADVEGKVSIAVLPFVNMSGEAENEFFSDGISEELLNLLAGISQFSVASRTSSFAFKGQDTPLPEIADRLGVRHVLEGSVRRQQGRVRITAQLIDARSDRHLWSQAYDRELSDIFAIQDEIASAITAALRAELGVDVSARGVTGRRPTDDLEAYDLFLKGRELWLQRGQANIEQAMGLLQEAVARDQAFAEAWAQLAAAYTVYPNWADVPNPPWQSLANAAAQLAIGLDPGVALAHAVVGSVRYEVGDFANALTELTRASDLQPGNATFHQWIAENLVVMGHLDAAEQAYRAAFERNPLAPAVSNVGLWIASVRHDGDAALVRSQHARGLGYRSDAGIDFGLAWQQGEIPRALELIADVDDVFGAVGLDRATHQAGLTALIDPTRTAEAAAAIRTSTKRFGSLDMWTIRYCEALGLSDLAVELILEYGSARPVWQSALWEPGSRLRHDPRVIDWLSRSPMMAAWAQHGPPDGCRIVNGRLDCRSG